LHLVALEVKTMQRAAAIVRPLVRENVTAETLAGELIRKALHLLIALVPLLAAYDLRATMLLLGGGTLFYVLAEKLRIEGRPVFIVSDLTVIASREHDDGRFVLGPVTLGLGAMLALMLYPSAAAAVAIWALAFGDGLASLAGKLFRTASIPFLGGKTVAGSLACFTAVLLSSWYITRSLSTALLVAAAATLLEMVPLKDFDNLLLPVGTGFLAARILAV
jgi:phytol kinase